VPSAAFANPLILEARKLDSMNWTQWGLFIQCDASSNDFIGEYQGDVQVKDVYMLVLLYLTAIDHSSTGSQFPAPCASFERI